MHAYLVAACYKRKRRHNRLEWDRSLPDGIQDEDEMSGVSDLLKRLNLFENLEFASVTALRRSKPWFDTNCCHTLLRFCEVRPPSTIRFVLRGARAADTKITRAARHGRS